MIDFQKSVLFKLDPIPVAQILDPINKFLIDGETVLSAFKMVRDQPRLARARPASSCGILIMEKGGNKPTRRRLQRLDDM
jgi:hypothetical protein